jgi:hypothetical protein
MDARERDMRANARVIDKIRIALPRELTEAQRAALVREFMAELTGGRVPWFAAIHQRGDDAHNPHVHIAVHDRDFETGRRVLRLSDSARDRLKAGLPGLKAVEWIRALWEDVCNEALARAGHTARIDRRTLLAQGIVREPTIHEGPRAQHIEGNVKRPESKKRVNGAGRAIDYPSIDNGRTRREFNAQIIDLNLERAIRSKNPATAAWAQFEKEQRALDAALEKRLTAERRARTVAERRASKSHLLQIVKLRTERDRALRDTARGIRTKFGPEQKALHRAQEQERTALKDRQSRLYSRILAKLDITGITRRRQDAARRVLAAQHKAARMELSARYHAERDRSAAAVKTRFAVAIAAEEKRRAAHLSSLKQEHRAAALAADRARQQREAEREHMRQVTENKIEAWQKTRKNAGPLGMDSALAKALERASKQEADWKKAHGKGREKDRDQDRDR